MIQNHLSQTLTLLFLGIVFSINASGAGFCGKVDFRSASNKDLENLVLLQNMSANQQVAQVNCGLPYENLHMCLSCESQLPEASMTTLRPILSQKSHIDWHSKWHKIRVEKDSIDQALFEKLQHAGIVPTETDRDHFFDLYGIGGKLAGENFFYMHRTMIKMVQFELSMAGHPCVSPWRELPAIEDRLWPVPRRYLDGDALQADRSKLETLRNQVARFESAEYLRNVSLNQLGRIVEPTLHQALHAFYQGDPKCSIEGAAQGICDDLLPLESAPLNKYFWKLHGLIDEILGKWLLVHGKTEIAVNCVGRSTCYQWTGTWLGKFPEK